MEDTVVEMKFDTKKAPLGGGLASPACSGRCVCADPHLPAPASDLPRPSLRQADPGADHGRIQSTEED